VGAFSYIVRSVGAIKRRGRSSKEPKESVTVIVSVRRTGEAAVWIDRPLEDGDKTARRLTCYVVEWGALVWSLLVTALMAS
jgi:hypothetical protein